jgi:hypothetical protein
VSDRVAEKVERYCGTPGQPGAIDPAHFEVLVMRGLGGFGKALKNFVCSAAKAASVDSKELLEELAVLYQFHTGDALVRAGVGWIGAR